MPMLTNSGPSVQVFFRQPDIVFTPVHTCLLLYVAVQNLDDFVDKILANHGIKDFYFLTDTERAEITQHFPPSLYKIWDQPYQLQYRGVEISVHCLQVQKKDGKSKITIAPWYLIPGRPYPVFVSLLLFWLHFWFGASCDVAAAFVERIYHTHVSHMEAVRSKSLQNILFRSRKVTDFLLHEQESDTAVDNWDTAAKYLSDDLPALKWADDIGQDNGEETLEVDEVETQINQCAEELKIIPRRVMKLKSISKAAFKKDKRTQRKKTVLEVLSIETATAIRRLFNAKARCLVMNIAHHWHQFIF